MKHALLAAITTLLFGCGVDGSSDTTSAPAADQIETVALSSIGTTTTLDESGTYDLVVSGLNNTLDFADQQSIRNLTVSGSNNMLSPTPTFNI